MLVTHLLWRDTNAGAYGHGSDGGGGGWAGLRQVLLVRIERRYLEEPGEPVEQEDHLYLTSLSPDETRGEAVSLLGFARGHWGIENHLHNVKDRSMGEDASRTRRGAVAMCWLRNVAVTLMPYLEGASAPQKAILAAANPGTVVKLLRAKRLKRCKRKV